MYINPRSNYTRHFRNKEIYDKANVSRVDNFIIKLVRDHFVSAIRIRQNSLIFGAFYPNPMYFEKTLNTGYIPPEAFPYLDANGYIQDMNNIPVIYHMPRHKNIKKITYPRMLNCVTDNHNYKDSMALPERDLKATYCEKVNRYWWLQ